jgi:hypothetical protein
VTKHPDAALGRPQELLPSYDPQAAHHAETLDRVVVGGASEAVVVPATKGEGFAFKSWLPPLIIWMKWMGATAHMTEIVEYA